MKKKGTWKLVLGVIMVLGAFSMFGDGSGDGFVAIIIGAALLAWWYLPRKSAADETAKSQAQPVKQSEIPATDTSGAQNIRSYQIKHYKVAGATYYESAYKQLAIENPDFDMSKKEIIDEEMTDRRIYQYIFAPKKVELIPEPTNEHDPNAIMVVVDGLLIGYIKAGNCAHLLKIINGKRIGGISIAIYGGNYKCVYSEYDDETDKEKYCTEVDSTAYGAKVEVIEYA